MVYAGIDKKIKELRAKNRMTQTDLARLLGVSKSVISSYENAVHSPPYDILIKLSRIFGVSCDFLLDNTTAKTISVDGLTDVQIQAVELIVGELRKLNMDCS